MDAQKAKEVLGEVIMHCENSETPPEHANNLAYIYSESEKKGLNVDYDDGFERHGLGEEATAIVVNAEGGDVVGEWSHGDGWSVGIR